MKSRLLLLSFFALCSVTANAQTPQWQWAKGVGGSHQDGPLGGINTNSMHTDTAGNVYEVITGESSAYTFGSYHFNNPYGSGANVGYFIKYNALGTVLWAKSFPQLPAYTGGGNMVPAYSCTTDDGNSYLLFSYRDSLRLGSFFITDTIWSTDPTHSSQLPYCIAQYDPNGNVVALHGYSAPHSGLYYIYKFYGSNMLALGQTNVADTLSGQPVRNGFFLAVMDSTGKVIRAKSLGRDTIQQFIMPSAVTAGQNAVYVQPTFYQSLVYQDAMPIGNIDAYQHGSALHLLIKFDSLLNFQWAKPVTNEFIVPMCTDKDDNVYIGGTARSTIVPDTLLYDTTRIVVPYLPPFGFYNYHTVIKIGATGAFQWVNMLPDAGSPGQTKSICTDRLDNLYMAGTYGSYLITGADTLTDAANIFVVKFSRSGSVNWSQSTHMGGRLGAYGLGEDGHGNIYMNGIYADPHFPVAFGHDTLICTQPVNNYPLAADVFTARLGNCTLAPPVLTATGALTWCGSDSVVLGSTTAAAYLWNTGDTTGSIVAKATGAYAVYATDSMGCYAVSGITKVQANTNPMLSSIVTKQVSCFGGNNGRINLQTTSGTAPYNYTYSPALNDINQVSANTYAITATDTFGCTAFDTITITQPASELSVQADTIAGSEAAMVTATGATPPYSYVWNTEPPQFADTAFQLTPEWHTVTVTDSLGCIKSDSVYISVYTGMADVVPAGIQAYPNPAGNMFYIETPANETIQVYDATGRQILQQTITSGVNKIVTGNWPGGIYQLVVIQGNLKFTDKLVVGR